MKLQHLRIRLPIPENGSGSDSDATVDYRDQQSSLAVAGLKEKKISCLNFRLILGFPLLFPWTGDKFCFLANSTG